MVAPTFKKPTDTSPGGSVVYGAPDLKYVLDVLDGTHATDRLQQINIEGLNPFFNYKAVMYKAGSVCKAFKDDGTLISSDTDAKVVLQAAINNITASGGKDKLVIKDGVYTINKQWTMPSNVEIWGESRDNTILKSASSIQATQCKNSDATGGNVNLTLANLTIDHIDVPLGDTNGACVSWNRVSKSTMYNCHMKNGASFTVFWSGNEVDLFDNVIANNIIDCDERTSKPPKDMWGGGVEVADLFLPILEKYS